MAENEKIFWYKQNRERKRKSFKFKTHKAAAGTGAWDVIDGCVTLEGKELAGGACAASSCINWSQTELNNTLWIILLTEHL